MIKIFVITVKGSNLPPSHLLCKGPGCYHSTGKTDVERGCFNWAQFMLQWFLDSLNSVNSVKVLLYLGKTPLPQRLKQRTLFQWTWRNIFVKNITAFSNFNYYCRHYPHNPILGLPIWLTTSRATQKNSSHCDIDWRKNILNWIIY